MSDFTAHFLEALYAFMLVCLCLVVGIPKTTKQVNKALIMHGVVWNIIWVVIFFIYK